MHCAAHIMQGLYSGTSFPNKSLENIRQTVGLNYLLEESFLFTHYGKYLGWLSSCFKYLNDGYDECIKNSSLWL